MRFISHFFLLSLLSSCFSNYENLTVEEKNFNPYSVGEQLIFESNMGEIDTFEITRIQTLYNDAPVILKEYKQTLRVWEGKNPPGEILDQRRLLLDIHSNGSDKPTSVEFFDFRGEIYFMDIPSIEKISVSTPKRTYNDVINLVDQPDERSKHHNYQIFWSVSEGLVKFETGDSTIWTLIKKKR